MENMFDLLNFNQMAQLPTSTSVNALVSAIYAAEKLASVSD